MDLAIKLWIAPCNDALWDNPNLSPNSNITFALSSSNNLQNQVGIQEYSRIWCLHCPSLNLRIRPSINSLWYPWTSWLLSDFNAQLLTLDHVKVSMVHLRGSIYRFCETIECQTRLVIQCLSWSYDLATSCWSNQRFMEIFTVSFPSADYQASGGMSWLSKKSFGKGCDDILITYCSPTWTQTDGDEGWKMPISSSVIALISYETSWKAESKFGRVDAFKHRSISFWIGNCELKVGNVFFFPP